MLHRERVNLTRAHKLLLFVWIMFQCGVLNDSNFGERHFPIPCTNHANLLTPFIQLDLFTLNLSFSCQFYQNIWTCFHIFDRADNFSYDVITIYYTSWIIQSSGILQVNPDESTPKHVAKFTLTPRSKPALTPGKSFKESIEDRASEVWARKGSKIQVTSNSPTKSSPKNAAAKSSPQKAPVKAPSKTHSPTKVICIYEN